MSTQPRADAPIGIFDSVVGGLPVARAVLDQLPGEIGSVLHAQAVGAA